MCTASVYVRETGNSFNRDWYLNAAPLITNGMLADFEAPALSPHAHPCTQLPP